MTEYGADSWDGGNYGAFRLTVWRFKDVTGAYAASLEPANIQATRVGNYLISCEGKCPKNLAQLADAALPHVSHGSPPSLGGYLPRRSLVPHSERYVIGPVGLHANAPQIPASVAAFDYSTEVQIARYRTPAGEETLAILSYPTPDLARQQLAAFQKLPDVTAKRSGPLVAAVLGKNSSAAQALLKQVNYGGIVETNETPPTPGLVVTPQTAGNMLVTIISLAGVVLGFCVVSGVAFGLMLMVARRFGYSAAEGSLITLHLSGD
ncbi:MAG TPA: hypothetical protein VMU80_20630 [Bryobacteraceae bacterium]|nr:hypothetical protein [Bryobacteraceae bacterium]HUO31640.1 hypothetical protein [Bryobacteraceae bacterium]